MRSSQAGFSSTILIVSVLVILLAAVGAIFLINPVEKARESRDEQRLQDLEKLRASLEFYLRNNAAEPNLCDGCSVGTIFTNQTINLPGLTVQTIATTDVGGTGWIPVDFSLNAGLNKTPVLVLPTDPTNEDPFVYTFTPGEQGKFKLTAKLEAEKNQLKMIEDGGIDDTRYEVGTDIFLSP